MQGSLPDACAPHLDPAGSPGLRDSCLDGERSLKALEQRQALAQGSGASQRAAERGVCNPKKWGVGGREEQTQKQGFLGLLLTGLAVMGISFALK